MTTIRRIDVMSAAKMYGALLAAVGLLIGAFISLFAILGASIAAANDEGGAVLGLLFGAGAIVVMPIMYGIMGFVGGAIQAFIYNVIAARVGGIQVELG